MHAYAFGTLPPNAAERFHQKKKIEQEEQKPRPCSGGGMLGKIHFSLECPIYNTAKRGGGGGVGWRQGGTSSPPVPELFPLFRLLFVLINRRLYRYILKLPLHEP